MVISMATKITVFRISLIPFFVASLPYHSPQNGIFRFVALGIFLLSIITDGIVGYIVRGISSLSSPEVVS